MGKAPRPRPARLAEKLIKIRKELGLSQDGMLIRLKLNDYYDRSAIAAYELGNNEPPLMVLLAYARSVNIYLDVLVDDALDLPDEIPSKRTSLGKKRKNLQLK